MAISPLRLIKNSVEYAHKSWWEEIPKLVRGIYVLYKYNPRSGSYAVVYVGMSTKENAGIRGRIKRHLKSKAGLWSHFSVYEVWDNISEPEVAELEGLFRHIYRLDARANKLNKMRSFQKLNQLRKRSGWFDEWGSR